MRAEPRASGRALPVIEQVVDTGRTASGEVVYRGAIAERADVEITLDASVASFDGTVVASFRDVSSRKAAEEALRRSEARFRALIQYSTDIIVMVDADGTLRYGSPAALLVLGYEPEALLGTSALALVHPDDLDVAALALADCASRPGVAPPATFRARHADGGWRWVESVGNNLLDDPSVGGLVLTARDVTDRRATSLALTDVNRVLRTVSAADAAVVHATSEPELLQEMCRVIVETGGYALAWIAPNDPTGAKPSVPAGCYPRSTAFHEQVMAASHGGPVQRGPVQEAMATGSTKVIRNLASLPQGFPLREVSLAFGFGAHVALPLIVDGAVVAGLSIHATEADAFDDDEIVLLEQLAGDLAFGIATLRARAERQQYLDRVQHNLDALIGTVAAAVEARDPYTAGHQRRVADLAVAIAGELGIDDDTIAGIRAAAGMHDLGKIAVPAEILSKPTALSLLEYELIKQHPKVGYDIVQGIDFPWPVDRMILEHHERLNGSGYPGGLEGPDILFGSCIIAVADVVEAMASHRPYRPGKGIDAALAQIEQDRGTLFAPDVVDACLRLFRDQRFAFDVA